MTLYLQRKGYTTNAEKHAMWLIDAINTVQSEGKKAGRELAKEGLMEVVKRMMR